MSNILSVSVGYSVLQVFLLIIGFVLLVKGADFFVDGASCIAQKMKISSFIIGATVVALGTSAPEMAVTVTDALAGDGDIIVGNILGSNIINILLILGISALVCPLPVEKTSRIIDIPLLIIVSAMFTLFGAFGGFSWWEGVILLALYAAFMAYNIYMAARQSKAGLEQASAATAKFDGDNVAAEQAQSFIEKIKGKYAQLKEKVWFLIILVVAGLAMVVGGAQLVVGSARYIATELFHIPTEIVALTVVAFGTSLPELVTSVSAARKGDVGIATGNIIGSNIANILLIGGLGAVCTGTEGLPFSQEGLVSGIVALIATVIMYAFCWGKNKRLGKIAGGVMLATLVLYYVLVFLNYYRVIVLY